MLSPLRPQKVQAQSLPHQENVGPKSSRLVPALFLPAVQNQKVLFQVANPNLVTTCLRVWKASLPTKFAGMPRGYFSGFL